jgi:hypothetical protein
MRSLMLFAAIHAILDGIEKGKFISVSQDF